MQQSSDMYSVFGQADINLEGNWRLTLGARYSNEDKDGSRKLTWMVLVQHWRAHHY